MPEKTHNVLIITGDDINSSHDKWQWWWW